jgi:hypothetical protein
MPIARYLTTLFLAARAAVILPDPLHCRKDIFVSSRQAGPDDRHDRTVGATTETQPKNTHA